MRYRYRGEQCAKNPFDLALYSLLLGRLRPLTILEIGSAQGGSALWFADQCRAHSLHTRIVSIDPSPPTGVDDPDVDFLEASIAHLDDPVVGAVLAECAHPLLVIEDGLHTYESCCAALAFVHPHLHPGDYVVVEDAIVADLRLDRFEDGPHRAVYDHLRAHPGEYVIDRDLCDFYGRNVTWNPDGWLRRV